MSVLESELAALLKRGVANQSLEIESAKNKAAEAVILESLIEAMHSAESDESFLIFLKAEEVVEFLKLPDPEEPEQS